MLNGMLEYQFPILTNPELTNLKLTNQQITNNYKFL